MVARPRRWDIDIIRKFMFVFGPISSVFDFVTFGLLLWVFHADEKLFHTGWFVESLSTQILNLYYPYHSSLAGPACASARRKHAFSLRCRRGASLFAVCPLAWIRFLACFPHGRASADYGYLSCLCLRRQTLVLRPLQVGVDEERRGSDRPDYGTTITAQGARLVSFCETLPSRRPSRRPRPRRPATIASACLRLTVSISTSAGSPAPVINSMLVAP